VDIFVYLVTSPNICASFTSGEPSDAKSSLTPAVVREEHIATTVHNNASRSLVDPPLLSHAHSCSNAFIACCLKKSSYISTVAWADEGCFVPSPYTVTSGNSVASRSKKDCSAFS
jgi:hypothetical protein